MSDDFYDKMGNIHCNDFDSSMAMWYWCFSKMLTSLCPSHTGSTARSLFWDWDMENWKAMWMEGSEYEKSSREELINSFKCECNYISDRFSYDRVFRTHWLWRQIWKEEIEQYKYPSLYEKQN